MENIRNIQEYILDPYQITGLVDSEGHFSFDIRNRSINFLFKVSQRDYSVALLEAIKFYFNSQGQINIDNEKLGTLQYNIRNINTLSNLIIPFFDQYPLLTSKALDYQDFKLALNHYQDCGLTLDSTNKKIFIELKNQMNLKRS